MAKWVKNGAQDNSDAKAKQRVRHANKREHDRQKWVRTVQKQDERHETPCTACKSVVGDKVCTNNTQCNDTESKKSCKTICATHNQMERTNQVQYMHDEKQMVIVATTNEVRNRTNRTHELRERDAEHHRQTKQQRQQIALQNE